MAKSEEFTGRSVEMKKPTEWLASEDIIGKTPVKVEIESVIKVTGAQFDDGRKQDVFTIKFKGKDKKLVMNSTNRKSLVNMFGGDVKDWKGKEVELVVVKVRAFGEWRHGIRIVDKTQTE